MEINYTDDAKTTSIILEKKWQHYYSEKNSGLIVAIENNYYEGIGKPEALKHQLSGL